MLVAVHVPFDRMNPYQRALADALGQLGVRVSLQPFRWHVLSQMRNASVLHIHWTHGLVNSSLWRFMLGFPYLALQLLLLRARGRRIVWTVHNLQNHEKRNLWRDRLITLLIGHAANSVVVHGERARHAVQKHFRIGLHKIASIPHGNYIGIYPNTISPVEARSRLRIPADSRVFLFLGNIRPYKGVETLIETFRAITDPNAVLVIAGRPIDAATEARIRDLSNSDARIRIETGFVKEEEIQVYMQAANVVVLPYKDVLTSGAVLLAMSFGRACIAPRLGTITDYLDDRGAFLYDPDDPAGLSKALQEALERSEQTKTMGKHNLQKAEACSWGAFHFLSSQQDGGLIEQGHE